jgi:hypothetical protein
MAVVNRPVMIRNSLSFPSQQQQQQRQGQGQDRRLLMMWLLTTIFYLSLNVPVYASSSTGTPSSLSSSSWSPSLSVRKEEAAVTTQENEPSSLAKSSVLTAGTLQRHEYNTEERSYINNNNDHRHVHLPPRVNTDHHLNTNTEYESLTIPPIDVCRYHLSNILSRIQHFVRRGGQSFWPQSIRRRTTHDGNDVDSNNNSDGDRFRIYPSNNAMDDVHHVVSGLLSTAKYVALGLLLVEAGLALKDILRDAWREASSSAHSSSTLDDTNTDESITPPSEVEGGGGGWGGRFGWGGLGTSNGRSWQVVDPSNGSSGNPPILSSADVQKLLLWLDQPRHIRQSKPPPRIPIAPWMVSVAQDLHDSCPALTMREQQRILSQLSRTDASLLQSCLLRHPSNAEDNPSSSSSNDQVGGLVNAKATIRRWVESAMSEASSSSSILDPSCVSATTSPYNKLISGDRGGLQGMVLWGPPGCGKSLLLRSISKQSGLPTLVVTPSLIQRKWYGESNQRVRSLFGLIRTLGSCVVVLDEVDGLFQARRDDDQEAGRDLKTEWFQWWDGIVALSSSSSSSSSSSLSSSESSTSVVPQHKVLIVAATNRPWDVDPAAWRRLPHRLYVGLPNDEDRFDLLLKWTSDLPRLNPNVLTKLINHTEGYTPSDLLQVLKWACQVGPIARGDPLLTEEDVARALAEIIPVRFSARYVQELRQFMGVQTKTSGGSTSPFDSTNRISTQQPPSNGMTPLIVGNEDGYCWETPFGNFYQFHVHLDSDAINTIQELYWNYMHKWPKDELENIQDYIQNHPEKTLDEIKDYIFNSQSDFLDDKTNFDESDFDPDESNGDDDEEEDDVDER